MADQFIGEVRVFTGDFAPRGWAVCDGQLLSVQRFRDLFSLLGTRFGGDGRDSFALPKLQGLITMHNGQGAGLSPREIGATGGVTDVALTLDQMPAHSHPAGGFDAVVTADKPLEKESPAGNVWHTPGDQRPQPNFYASDFDKDPQGSSIRLAMNEKAIPTMGGTTGGTQQHTNMMPYVPMLYCIAIEGEFPRTDGAAAADAGSEAL